MNINSKQFQSIVPGSTNSVTVNGDINFALRQWKKNLKDNKIIETIFDNKTFHKKSDIKRKQNNIAKYNQQKVNVND